MVCYWAVQREQNKEQTHGTPFNSACKKKKFGTVGAMAPAPLSLKLEEGGAGGGGGSHIRTGPAPPPWIVLRQTSGWRG